MAKRGNNIYHRSDGRWEGRFYCKGTKKYRSVYGRSYTETKEKLDKLREADAIFREELINSGLDHLPSQYFAVLTNTLSVGVQGDARVYDNVVALRAVDTDDFMTADFSRIPLDVLARISSRIMNEVKGLSRVVYDITSKPPATVEWE